MYNINVKYIILGKTGYIGQAFETYFNNKQIEYESLSREWIDYTKFENIHTYIQEQQKHNDLVVINCAGYIGKPNVDACELAKADTIAGNVVFPSMLATVCDRLDVPLVHISSGCIYGGYEKQYTEQDKPNFTFDTGSFYSGTKALAETLVARNSSMYYIFRLRIPFDHVASPRNYLTKLLTYDTLLDMRNSVSHRHDFVKYCHHLVKRNAPYGIYNITNPGSVTTREVVDMLNHYYPAAKNKQFNFFDNEQQFNKIATAPRSNCVLDTTKLENMIETRPALIAMETAIMRYTV